MEDPLKMDDFGVPLFSDIFSGDLIRDQLHPPKSLAKSQRLVTFAELRKWDPRK